MEAYGQVKGRKYPSNHIPAVIDSGLITCTKCGKELPEDRYYKANDKPQQPCIACKLEADRVRREQKVQRTCKRCGETFPLTQFRRTKDGGHERMCIPCADEYCREHNIRRTA